VEIAVSIAVIASAIATAIAAAFVALQIVQMKDARFLDSFLEVYRAANEDYMREATWWVKHNLDDTLSYDAVVHDEPAWRRISEVGHFFEMVGVLVLSGHLPRQLAFDQMGTLIGGMWHKLAPIIEEHRRKKEDPTYYENFERLALACDDWLRATTRDRKKRWSLIPKAALLRGYYAATKTPPSEEAGAAEASAASRAE
jgi:hypothetical protein